MSKTVTWILVVVLVVVLFLFIPLFLPNEDNYATDNEISEEYNSEEYGSDESDDFDIDGKKKSTSNKSARSVGGSKSFRSGK